MVFPHTSDAPASAAVYPHLVVRLMASVFQRTAIPEGLTRTEIVARTQHFAASLDLSVGIVWAANRATYVQPDGATTESTEPPHGGIWVNVQLPPLVPVGVAYAVRRQASSAVREVAARLIGRWALDHADAEGVIRADAPRSLLELHDDGTYVWHACPVWSTGGGRWQVWRTGPDRYDLGFEETRGVFNVHRLVPDTGRDGRSRWGWRDEQQNGPGDGLLFEAGPAQ